MSSIFPHRKLPTRKIYGIVIVCHAIGRFMNTMWCETCRQDVPGVASAEDAKLCCARCGSGLGRTSSSEQTLHGLHPTETAAPTEASANDASASADPDAPPRWDDWDSDEQLRHIQRKLGTAGASNPEVQAVYRRERSKLDSGHAGPPAWHWTPRPEPAAQSPSKAPAATSSSVPGLAWVVLSLGLMAVVCGGVLLGWSAVTGRGELWSRGMPFVVGGQVALLLGLILQLERLWRDGRQTASKLEDVGEELHGLKSSTAMLGTTHSSAASAFYCHMAGGANSQLLLNDLKGQLDMLALRIGQEEHRRP